jgi:two-component system, chemotaxis family, CheB/CheR fusion protein
MLPVSEGTPDDGSLPEAEVSPELTAPVDFVARARLPFPVTAIGASAGGIDALKAFFEAVPAGTGIAFVVVQHLPPDRESAMAEILARHSALPVHQIHQAQPIEPDHVYVIRPGYTLTLCDGAFVLGASIETRGHGRPIDDFLRSLAREQQEKSIAVVLSGTGMNGTAGAQAIKAVGGLCIAQSPETAEFASMPQSVIQAGYADAVLPPAQIPALILQYLKNPYAGAERVSMEAAREALQADRAHLTEIFSILRARTTHDFSGYKKPTILRRIQRRMGLAAVQTLADYLTCLQSDAEEVRALANDLLINVTGFFRDPQAWEALRVAAVRPLIEEWNSDAPIRGWVTACSSGEEAYSLAMLIHEEIERLGKRIQVKIFATDTAEKSLMVARAGVYPGGIEGELTPDRLARFFDKDEHTYRIKKEIRDSVVFAPQDVLRDPPFSKVDLCTCRNLLIYLEPDVQMHVLGLLHFALRDGGYLLLGTADAGGTVKELFGTVNIKWRIYRRESNRAHRLLELPRASAYGLAETQRLEALVLRSPQRSATTLAIQQALFDQFGPPTVVVDRSDRIVYYHGDTRAYFITPIGEPTLDLFEVIHEALRPAVRQALRRANTENGTVRVTDAALESAPESLRVHVTAAPLQTGQTSEYFRVSFEALDPAQAPAPAGSTAAATSISLLRLVHSEQDHLLEAELRSARRDLQSVTEAFQSNNEELKASNEEVISINEELQSANEELESSKEELQSLNEELIAANAQLQTKIGELEAANNDLSNLWSSTSIAVVFLDTQLRVRRFTPAMSDLLELLPGDIGRPIAHFAPKLTRSDLVDDARQVLSSRVPSEAEMSSHSGAWYLRRTLPYRTADQRIDGIVITFFDITARKRAEDLVEAAQARLSAVIEQMPAAMLLVEAPLGKLLYGNRRAAELFGLIYPLPYIGAEWAAATATFKGFDADGQTYQPQQWPLARTLASGSRTNDEEITFARADGASGTVSVSAAPVYNTAGELIAAVATFFDITERKRMETAVRESEERFRLLIESARDYAIFLADMQGRITTWNSGAERMLGWSEAEALGRPMALLFTPEDRSLDIPEREMRTALETGRAAGERTHVRRDGSRLWASGTLTTVLDPDGGPRGFAMIMRDCTQLRQAQEDLQAALDSSEALRVGAESANRSKDEFISTVSHELRTPLNTIRLWLRLLESEELPRDEVVRGLKAMERAVLSQQALIDDLLDVSRMAAGKLRLDLRNTRLVEVVRACLEAVGPGASSRDIDLESHLDDEVGIVRVDPERFQQVVANLLSNAVKFTPSGGQVRVQLSRSGDFVELVVADTGVGIRRDFLPHVFERFRQAERVTTRQHAGLGLGLSIARELVELHGGTISAESAGEGRGATFTARVALPRQPATDWPGAEAPGAPSRGLRGVAVLVVEDETATSAAVRRLLEAEGAHVQVAASVSGAAEAYRVQRPDLILCDIGLPGEDGYSLLRLIREREELQSSPRVPAVAVTAFAGRQDRERALAAGFDEHLPKPVAPERLISVLEKIADTARSASGEEEPPK